MINISVRNQRLLKMWAVNFLIVAVSAIAFFVVTIGGAVGLIVLSKAYGPGVVLAIMLGIIMLIGAGLASFFYAKEKLQRLEQEEERTLKALQTDYTPVAKFKVDNTKAHKYYNILYGQNNTKSGVKK